MKKVVVFDYGWGGELVADYLSRELAVVEVVRVIDWGNAEYYSGSIDTMFDMAQKSLRKYLGLVDLIVLGGYGVSILYDKFQEMYPYQCFVCMDVKGDRVFDVKTPPSKIAVLGEPFVLECMTNILREELGVSMLVFPDCDGWEKLIDRDLMSRELLRSELAWDFQLSKERPVKKSRQTIKGANKLDGLTRKQDKVKGNNSKDILLAVRNLDRLTKKVKAEEQEWIARREPAYARDNEREKISVDTVILLSTHFWAIKSDLEELFGWRVRVIDFREVVLRNVCLALRLRGVDGRRAKR